MNDDNANELYRRYRPKTFKEVVGQDEAVRILQSKIKGACLPRVILLSGPSGTGKTTLARILATKLGCDTETADFTEMNCADTRGIDGIREIRQNYRLSPISACRIYILDEMHRLTGDSMSALLKMLEDTPRHVYFFLCTTDPGKLLKTILTRCTQVVLKPLSSDDIRQLLTYVLAKENTTIGSAVVDRIAEVSDGSARQALVLLNQVVHLESEEDQLAVVLSNDAKRQAWDVVKALLYEKTTWASMAKLIKETDLGDPERFRHLVLACANTEMLKGGKSASWAWLVHMAFKDAWYDCPKSGLVGACFECLQERK